MAYSLGHVPDHPAVVAARVGFHLHPEYGAIRAGSLPLFTTNRALLRWLRNQTDVGGCEGCANSSGATLQLALDGTPIPEPISHVATYIGAKLVDLVPNLDGSLPAPVDEGTGPASIMAAWQLWGGAPESVWGQLPMSSRTMYVDPTGQRADVKPGALIAPSPNQLYTGRTCRLQGAYFVTTTGTALVRDVARVLASRRVLTNAICGSNAAFQGYSGGVVGLLAGPIDHAQLVVDYSYSGSQADLDAFMGGDDSKVAPLLIHCTNSWGGVGCPDGGDWGEVDALNGLGGQYRAGPAYFQNSADWCVLSVKKVA